MDSSTHSLEPADGPSPVDLASVFEASKANSNRRTFTSQLSLTTESSHQSRTMLIAAWTVHFISSISILWYAARNHGERKYIPVDVTRVDSSYDCVKAFVDVFSPSEDSPGAFVCCSRSERIDSALCTPPPSYLPFARRLARFPDVWLLPLFPFFIRGAVYLFRILRGHAAGSPTQITTAMRRLYLYIGLIQVRGWVLYLVFDQLEEFLVATVGNDCWYHHLLPVGHAICQGRVTDFSDHVVLYFAQITPMALTEVLHSLAIPYWNSADGPGKSGNRLMPTLLIVGMLYLYFITFLGAYKTAAYFHTGPEILVGYLVSLFVQVPLFVLQCTRTWPKARECFFGCAG